MYILPVLIIVAVCVWLVSNRSEEQPKGLWRQIAAVEPCVFVQFDSAFIESGKGEIKCLRLRSGWPLDWSWWVTEKPPLPGLTIAEFEISRDVYLHFSTGYSCHGDLPKYFPSAVVLINGFIGPPEKVNMSDLVLMVNGEKSYRLQAGNIVGKAGLWSFSFDVKDIFGTRNIIMASYPPISTFQELERANDTLRKKDVKCYLILPMNAVQYIDGQVKVGVVLSLRWAPIVKGR